MAMFFKTMAIGHLMANMCLARTLLQQWIMQLMTVLAMNGATATMTMAGMILMAITTSTTVTMMAGAMTTGDT